jgi:hypothetical protein
MATSSTTAPKTAARTATKSAARTAGHTASSSKLQPGSIQITHTGNLVRFSAGLDCHWDLPAQQARAYGQAMIEAADRAAKSTKGK